MSQSAVLDPKSPGICSHKRSLLYCEGTENETREKTPMISIIAIALGYVVAVACTRGAATVAAKAILGRGATHASV